MANHCTISGLIKILVGVTGERFKHPARLNGPGSDPQQYKGYDHVVILIGRMNFSYSNYCLYTTGREPEYVDIPNPCV